MTITATYTNPLIHVLVIYFYKIRNYYMEYWNIIKDVMQEIDK